MGGGAERLRGGAANAAIGVAKRLFTREGRERRRRLRRRRVVASRERRRQVLPGGDGGDARVRILPRVHGGIGELGESRDEPPRGISRGESAETLGDDVSRRLLLVRRAGQKRVRDGFRLLRRKRRDVPLGGARVIRVSRVGGASSHARPHTDGFDHLSRGEEERVASFFVAADDAVDDGG